MLVTFKSKAAADVYMYAEHAKMLLFVMGKKFEPSDAPRGIITAEEIPAALAKLKAASDAAKRSEKENDHGTRNDDAVGTISVGIAQRAYPIIHMLELAAEAKREVVWGV